MNSQDGRKARQLDLLAAVVLHTLVTRGRDGMTFTEVATACERDPHSEAEMSEINAALDLLLEDGLTEREGAPNAEGVQRDGSEDRLFRPTRAAVRASELSF